MELKDEGLNDLARGVVAALAGFVVSAAFVSIEGAELPYFVVILGAGVLKLNPVERASPARHEEWAHARTPSAWCDFASEAAPETWQAPAGRHSA
jgi:hypothetical protein